ncbi:MAG: N-acetyl-alpha-D-glucosaminyl L-malate synthase BshA, partial [Bacteroidetes bacterium]|nr:N-acetyl-alpha-D-glucosaminyl L-malate synthase BshA [Bacteroidota bacterium]
INHNETGFIAEIGDVDRMAKYAVDLLGNDRKYKLFSKNARDRAVNKFDKSKIIPIYEEFYKRVLNS